jgi:SAM-dependent methyltransferase
MLSPRPSARPSPRPSPRPPPRGLSAEARPVARALRTGQRVIDRDLDEVFPLDARRSSKVHWTPVAVAAQAARLLADRPGVTILDVGSGVGKFCLVAAATVRARIRGIEQRAHLVDIARCAAAKLEVNVEFIHGTIASQDPRQVDGIYLFNPFAENLSPTRDRIDNSVELSPERFRRDVDATEQFLRGARVGTRVVTYCGFGGTMPDDYVMELREWHGSNLELWVKRR